MTALLPWLIIAVLAYVFLIPGGFLLICLMDRAVGKDHENSWDAAQVWPAMVLAAILLLIVMVLYAPFKMMAVGRDGFIRWIDEGLSLSPPEAKP